MRIDSSQQMFRHIENGGNLKLNSDGQLETQSAAGHFFQKIGDAFRSLSAGGRASIETRNARLHEAMADMVRRDALVNPAQANIPQPPISQLQRSRMCANLAMAGELTKLPPETRAATRALVLYQLEKHDVLNRDAGTIRANIPQFMQIITGDPVLSSAMKCSYSRTREQLQPMMNDSRNHRSRPALKTAYMRFFPKTQSVIRSAASTASLWIKQIREDSSRLLFPMTK